VTFQKKKLTVYEFRNRRLKMSSSPPIKDGTEKRKGPNIFSILTNCPDCLKPKKKSSKKSPKSLLSEPMTIMSR